MSSVSVITRLQDINFDRFTVNVICVWYSYFRLMVNKFVLAIFEFSYLHASRSKYLFSNPNEKLPIHWTMQQHEQRLKWKCQRKSNQQNVSISFALKP